ncbi:CotY/CotZ family spore coat protein [Aquibacillus kalidii]|uniref:CotY/CotZ family spore coat protein n=1 Tax=Aquibacillus kalidii TaxID=2762597 RepID=UPI00164525A8|nr:CotY/CotZ family spore coat protein [Aquibacillus kalidii]
MACGSNYDSGNCVADILRDIADAQTDLVGADCTTSCEQSISDLLGDNTLPIANTLDTVPVILYCKGDCKPFKGYGAPLERGRDGRGEIENVFGSFFFRVKSVDEDNCAVLELLRSEEDARDPHDCDPKSPADQDVEDLEVTGVCITVDLDCFCHVTCLPAISALDL